MLCFHGRTSLALLDNFEKEYFDANTTGKHNIHHYVNHTAAYEQEYNIPFISHINGLGEILSFLE